MRISKDGVTKAVPGRNATTDVREPEARDLAAFLTRVRTEIATDFAELLNSRLDDEQIGIVMRATDTLARAQLELLMQPDEVAQASIEQSIADAASTLASMEALNSIDIASRVAETTSLVWSEARELLIAAAITAVAGV